MTQREMHGNYPEYTVVNHEWEEVPHDDVDFSNNNWSAEINDGKLYLRHHDYTYNTSQYYKCPPWIKQLIEDAEERGRAEIKSKLREILSIEDS